MLKTTATLPINALLRSLVHPATAGNAGAAARHRALMAGHLVAGMLALAALPVYLALGTRPSAVQVLAFVWMSMPLAIAMFLSRTGRAEVAHLLSGLSLTGLVVTVAAATGGLSSYALVWLLIVPVEAALSGSRRVVLRATALAGFGVGLLMAMQAAAILPVAAISAQSQTAFAAFLVIGALAYACGLAVSLQSLHQDSESATRLSNARYDLLADNVSDMITRHGAGGAIEFASTACERLLGMCPADLLGNGLFERVHVADRPAYLHALSVSYNEGRALSLEFRLRRESAGRDKFPSYFWVEARFRHVADEPDKRGHVIAVMRDVSERKESETALQTALEDAEQANAAKSRFLANMSHELRTPLNAVIGFSEILAGDMIEGLEPARRREYARLIHESGSHLLQVVNDVLDVSRIEAGTFPILAEPFDLKPLVEGCCRMMACQAAKAGLRLETEIEASLPEVLADKRACRQILINLLSNAIKFTEAGGHVTVRVHRRAEMIALSVSDTGIGIAGADMPRLGTPFVQADSSYDRRYEGVGLGLSVVKGLVALHEGEFSIASEVGQGTDVTVALPLAGESGCDEAAQEPERARRAVGA